MANLVEIVVRAKDDTKTGFAAATVSADSMSARLQKIGTIGAVGLGAVAVASVVMAAKFNSAMELIHTQAGVAQNKIAGLEQGVLSLAGKVGFSPDSLADALYHIESSFASVGITGPKALNLLKIAAEGAAVGHANLTDVTNALDAAIASGIPGVKNMSQAMGVLNATVGSGDMHMQDLADAFGTGVLAVVKGFGLSIKDVGAALAVFGDNNIRGAQAGTALRVAVQALAAPVKAGIPVLEKLGITSNQLAKDMQTGGLLKAITDLKTHMTAAGISAAQQGQIITEAFGKKAGTGVNILVGQFDRLKSKYPDMTKGASQFGNAWASTNQTMTQQWHELDATVQSLAIQIGEKLMPYVQKLMTFLLSHKTVVTDVAVAILALTAALTAYTIVAKVAAIVTLALSSPWTAIIALVILLAAVIIKYHKQIFAFIVKTWTDVKNFVIKIWNDIMTFAKQWWPLLLGPSGLIIKYHQQIWSFIQSIWHTIANFLSSTWNSIKSGASIAWNGIKSTVTSIVSSLVNTVRSTIAKLPGDIASIFRGAGNWLVQAGKDVIQGFLNGLKAIWGSITSFISGIASWIKAHKGPIGLDHNLLVPAGKAIMNGFFNGLKSEFKPVTDFISGVASHVSGVFEGVSINLGSTGLSFPGSGIIGAIGSLLGGGGSPAPDVFGGSVQQLMQQMAAARGWTGSQWTALYDVEMREAGFNLNARNPSSGAYGLAQFINGPSEYAQYGGNSSTAAGQITGMLNYIAQRYGSPAAAWQHELNFGWYDNGGWLKPGYTLAYNGTGKPEQVGGGQDVHVHLHIDSSGAADSMDEAFLKWLRNKVRVKGGGNVQRAFGRS